jgi:peptidoglycan/xylan/chitin deacetylase (PgdA/CDA1 family)
MSLIDFANAVKERSLPDRAIVVTFDDGYVDNFTTARPILEMAQVPATLFVATGYVDGTDEFWWDKLESIFLSLELPLRPLRIVALDQQYEWTINSETEREPVRKALYDIVRPLSIGIRNEVLSQLTARVANEPTARPGYRPLTSNELAQLAQDGLLDFGAHTVNHPMLSSLPADEQLREMIESREHLEAIVGRQIATFAYPYGKAGDITQTTVETAQAAGFQAACTTFPGSIESGDNLFLLRRSAVKNWNSAQFRRKLDSLFVS